METKVEPEYPTSPANDDSGDEDQDPVDPEEQGDHDESNEAGGGGSEEEEESGEFEEEHQNKKTINSNVADILKRLQSAGALIKKPKQEFKCNTCVKEFSDWEELENHLIQHVSLPTVVLDKLPSDEEDTAPSGDENWSDEEEVPQAPKQNMPKTPQKIDISQILKKTGLSFKSQPSGNNATSSDSALSKLSGLGFTIKKNTTPIKKESDSESQNENVMQKLGKLGGIKLKLKSDGNNGNSFKVVNGLKDFKASDDEDEGSGNEEVRGHEDESMEDEIEKNEGSGDEQDNADEEVEEEEEEEEQQQPAVKNRVVKSESDEELQNPRNLRRGPGRPPQRKQVVPKTEPPSTPIKKAAQPPPQLMEIQQKKTPGRPAVKQTPKRGANQPVVPKEPLKQVTESPVQTRRGSTPRSEPTPRRDSTHRRESVSSATQRESVTSTSTPERSESRDSNSENVVVKQEADEAQYQGMNMPLFSGKIKTERTSPPLHSLSTPIIATVKADPDAPPNISQLSYNNQITPSTPTTPLLPVTKTEDAVITIIEINGDSNDEDDDCCVVSATPAPDVKPTIVPKTENLPPAPYSSTSVAYSTAQSTYSSPTPLPSRLSSSTTPSTEKQHSFNWNAPDSKPPIDMLEKSADEIFESLLSSSTKKENMSMSDASEYISLDTLGPQHSCDICNTRFTDISLLEDHKRITGHSKSLVAPSSSTLLPYSPSSNILSSLLPVKQLAEQVGKLSTLNSSGPGFTHQQNVMINIQAYPGAGGVMVPPPSYNTYPSGQNMHPGYSQTSNNLYGNAGQMPGQYPPMSGQNYMGQGYGQYQPPMSKAGYAGPVAPNTYSSASSPYSSASPLQSMQQSVYGQPSTGMMNQQSGQMMPPGSSPSHQYNPASSPGGSMKPNSGIRIQNVQTFPPGQLVGGPGQVIAPGPSMGTTPEMGPGQLTAPGQVQGGQMPPPTQLRMAAGANVAGTRPRLPTVRGQRPTIRPGIQVHGQVRGAGKAGPRMPLKRPGQMMGGPGQKRRNDMLLPGKHDNEDCQVMALQKQREGLPMISSVQGARDKINLGGQISITKKTVNKEANAMANVLASRGISVKQKAKSRSPTPERPIPHIPNLGAGVSIKHTSKSSNFSIPEAKVGGGMLSCKICKKMFMNYNSLTVHMTNAHPQSKIPVFKCDECPASYPKLLQLQHHKRVFHNVSGPNRELGLPVVDLSQEDNLKRLSSLGIYSFIPLANREQASGCFGIPVISVHNMQNGMTVGLQALGADGLLSLGPLKPLPNS